MRESLANIPAADLDTTLEKSSWNAIAYHAYIGDLGDYFEIGDTKDLTLKTGEKITMVLADINHSGVEGTADFICKNCMSAQFQMNFTSNNSYGWSCSNMRSYLNGLVLRNIPDDCADFIIPKTVATYGGSSFPDMYYTDDFLWLLTEYEVGLSEHCSSDEKDYQTTYPIFTDDASRRKKVGGAVDFWWLASPRSSKNQYFCFITAEGISSYYFANSSYGVVFGFRV